MQISELDYTYPEYLVATQPRSDFRTLVVGPESVSEISKKELLNQFQSGDILLINDTQVIKRRLFTADGLEILFVSVKGDNTCEVLFPARGLKIGDGIELPGGVSATLISKGLPQILKSETLLTPAYFDQYGELALPPYIQKARGQRHMLPEDESWYQTQWAKNPGSCAAPTASLHFTSEDLALLRSRRVKVMPVTLHVGLGTFLPIKTDRLDDHTMHAEWCAIKKEAIVAIEESKKSSARVWALGTTVTRAIESWSQGLLDKTAEGDFHGSTRLFIQPGFEFKVVDVLMTNFHQPRSTLLAMTCAWAGRQKCLDAYQWAIDHQFRLFSYGDLSVWMK